MSLHPGVLVFMLIWFAGVASFLAAGLLFDSKDSEPIVLIPLGMLVFGWAMTQGGFLFEARKARKILQALFSNTHMAGPS